MGEITFGIVFCASLFIMGFTYKMLPKKIQYLIREKVENI